MDSPASNPEKSPVFPLQDVQGDTERTEHVAHDPASEIRHAWEHFWENFRFFVGGFFPVILLTVIAFNVDFGSSPIVLNLLLFKISIGTGNFIATIILAAMRSGLIAYFLSTLFKDFSFVFRTLFFTVIFLGGMIFLSLWDSEIVNKQGHGIGNPIWDKAHPESMRE